MAYAKLSEILDVTDIRGKKILDVGFGTGEDAAELRSHGGVVFGVEPDASSYNQAVTQGHIDADKAYNCKIQDLPEEHLGTFDLVTLGKFQVPAEEHDSAIHALNKAISPSGKVVITTCDLEYLKNSNPTAIEPRARQFFEMVRPEYYEKNETYIYNLSNPRKEPLLKPPHCAQSFADIAAFQKKLAIEQMLNRMREEHRREQRPAPTGKSFQDERRGTQELIRSEGRGPSRGRSVITEAETSSSQRAEHDDGLGPSDALSPPKSDVEMEGVEGRARGGHRSGSDAHSSPQSVAGSDAEMGGVGQLGSATATADLGDPYNTTPRVSATQPQSPVPEDMTLLDVPMQETTVASQATGRQPEAPLSDPLRVVNPLGQGTQETLRQTGMTLTPLATNSPRGTTDPQQQVGAPPPQAAQSSSKRQKVLRNCRKNAVDKIKSLKNVFGRP